MDIVSILVTLLVIALIGFIVYLITEHIPMPPIFKQVIIVICAILIILYVISLLTGHITPIKMR